MGGKGRGLLARLPGGPMKGLSLEALSPGNAQEPRYTPFSPGRGVAALGQVAGRGAYRARSEARLPA